MGSLFLGVGFCGESLVGLAGGSLDPALGIVEPGGARRLRDLPLPSLEPAGSVSVVASLAVACCDDHVLARHLDAFAFPFARTVGLHVNTDCLHEVGLVFARDLAYVVVLYLDAVSADVFDAEAVGLTAQLGDYLAFGLLLRLHTTHLRMRERPLFERLYPRNRIRLLQGAECFEYSFLNQNPKR